MCCLAVLPEAVGTYKRGNVESCVLFIVGQHAEDQAHAHFQHLFFVFCYIKQNSALEVTAECSIEN